jgi:hypothetical protein
MKLSKKTMKSHIVIGVAVVVVASPIPAAAYVDPVTGSIVLQVALGGLLAALAMARLYWHRLKALFHGKSENNRSSENLPL